MSTILIASNIIDPGEHLQLAQEYQCGLEIGAFYNPVILHENWRKALDRYKADLGDFPGPYSCHGAFFDLTGSSEDPAIVELSRQRYLLNLDIAAELGAKQVIFHTNFLPMIRTELYRRRWIERNIQFWNDLGAEAAKRNLWIAVENMWDPDPGILRGLMEGLSVPNVGVCLDISHVYLYNYNRPLDQWIEALAPFIIHTHINNTLGVIDEHLALNAPGGLINYRAILPRLTRLPRRPWIILEMDNLTMLQQSLNFTRLTLGTDFGTTEPLPADWTALHPA